MVFIEAAVLFLPLFVFFKMQWSMKADTVPVTNTFGKDEQFKKYSEPCSWRWTGRCWPGLATRLLLRKWWE